MIVIGSARINEKGTSTGGLPGDQTGKEVSTQNFYNHSKGWRVFRAVEPGMRELIAVAMQRACDNMQVGYDQTNRNKLFNVSKIVEFDPGHVAIPVQCDCSALVRVCVAYAGLILPNFTTLTEAKVLIESSAFFEIYCDAWKQQYLLERGDILVTKTKGHTAVVLQDGHDMAGSDYANRRQVAPYFDRNVAGVYRAISPTPARYIPRAPYGDNVYKMLDSGDAVRCYGFYDCDGANTELFCVLSDGKTAFVDDFYLERY